MEPISAVRSALLGRRSCRRGYTAAPVDRAVLLDLVAAGVAAPSGSNTQSIRFIVETRPDEIERLSRYRCDADRVLAQARALVLVFADKSRCPYLRTPAGKVWSQLPYMDAAAAIQNVLTLATAYGLGSCWVSALASMERTGHLNGRTWAEALAPYALPMWLEPMGIVALGHTDGPPKGDESHRGRPVARGPLADYLLSVDGVRP